MSDTLMVYPLDGVIQSHVSFLPVLLICFILSIANYKPHASQQKIKLDILTKVKIVNRIFTNMSLTNSLTTVFTFLRGLFHTLKVPFHIGFKSQHLSIAYNYSANIVRFLGFFKLLCVKKAALPILISSSYCSPSLYFSGRGVNWKTNCRHSTLLPTSLGQLVYPRFGVHWSCVIPEECFARRSGNPCARSA